MAREGGIECQDLQQILDNLVKEEEEEEEEEEEDKGNKNISSTATLAIWDNISNALDEWLYSISILEERERES